MPTPSFRLTSLTLRAFRSVVKEQTLALPQTGMHLISGPSGAGKTTIAEGIAFALGYSSISATALQSWDWLTDQPLRDVLEVETSKGTLRITRGKGASVLMPGEEKPRTSAAAVKEGISQALGIDPDFLKVLTYRGQKTPGLFLSMTDSGKKQFLTQLLGLEKFERAAEKSLANISALDAQVSSMTVRLQTLEGVVPVPQAGPPAARSLIVYQVKVEEAEKELADLLRVVEETKALDYELTQRQAAQVEATNAEWRPKLLAVEAALSEAARSSADTSRYDSDLQVLNEQAEQLRKQHRTEMLLVEKELNATRDLYAGLKAFADKRGEAEGRLAHARAHLDKLKSGTCFTCQRPWGEDPNKAREAARCDTDIAALEKVISDADLAAAQLPMMEKSGLDLKAKLRGLQATEPVPADLRERQMELVKHSASARSERDARVANAKAEYHRVHADANRARESVSRMTTEEEQVRRTLADLGAAVATLNGKVALAKNAVTAAQRENEMSMRSYREYEDRRNTALAAASKARKDLEVSVAAAGQEKDFLAMVRGFLSYIFDETLARIADAANARIALIPNVSNVTLRFASERETGTGKLRQEITAVCEKNGHVIPLKDGISGGMYTAVELAVDLSLADVIADRTGVYPGWLTLDEAFEGLDDAAKTACFDMLKSISVDRAVFVVDHTESMKELFDSRIGVAFDGERSTITLP